MNWNKVCEATPKTMPDINELEATKIWQELIKSANKAFEILMIRGYLCEDK